jgi:hypothetical protein
LKLAAEEFRPLGIAYQPLTQTFVTPSMNKTNKYIVLVVAGLLLLADKAMAFPNALAFATTPDGGSTALLLVAGLGGLALLRRFGRTK